MKYRKLNFWTGGVIIAAALTITMIGCNNNTESAKDSTTKNDTSASTTPTTETTVKTKKTGKASASAATAPDKSLKMQKDKIGYYNYTEVAPVYPGGQTALETYINNNITYPQDAIDNNVQGTVSVQFAIDENGNVSQAKEIGNKLGYGLDEEAVRIVSQMPKWTPGQVSGKSVKAWYTLPITYKIEES